MDSLDGIVRASRALADPTRVRILAALRARALCVCELVALTGLGQPAVSHHLAILEAAGFVAHERHGRWVEYRPVRPPAGSLAAAALRAIAALCATEPELVRLLDRAASIDGRRRTGALPPRGGSGTTTRA